MNDLKTERDRLHTKLRAHLDSELTPNVRRLARGCRARLDHVGRAMAVDTLVVQATNAVAEATDRLARAERQIAGLEPRGILDPEEERAAATAAIERWGGVLESARDRLGRLLDDLGCATG